MNARYQKYQEPAGKTRKSAAAAKPSRKAADSSSSGSKSSSKSKDAARQARLIDPPSPAFKRLRTIWWILLGAGVVLVAISWAVRTYTSLPSKDVIGAVTLGLAYGAIIAAFFIDFSKMRPMRDAWRKSGKLPEDTASKSASKPAKSDSKDASSDTPAEKTGADGS